MSENQVEEIKQKVDLVDIIGERVELKKAGKNFKGLCPFHGEKSPSFFVSPDMQLFTCFGCQEKGDVYSFLQKFEGWTFGETLEFLAKKVGIRLEKRTGGAKSEESFKEKLYTILSLAGEYYRFLLNEHKVGAVAIKYLEGRGLSKQTRIQFGLGYAPDGWRNLYTFLVEKKHFKVEEVEAAGLIIKSTNTKTGRISYYDRFRGRVIFPLLSNGGKVVGFSGRIVKVGSPSASSGQAPSASSGQAAKYINSPETVLYHKGDLLFGLIQAKKAIKEKNRVILVEGEMDALMSHQAFVNEVVAIKGSALTENQAVLLKRLTQTIVLALDADKAGQEAMRRAIFLGEKVGLNMRVLPLSGGKDPGELAAKDPSSWKEMCKNTVSVHEFLLDQAVAKNDPNTGEGQKAIVGELLEVWSKLTNLVEQSFWLKKLAEKLKLDLKVLEKEMQKKERGEMAEETTVKKTEKKLPRVEVVERYVLALVLMGESFGKKWWLELEEEWFSLNYLKRLLIRIKEVTLKNPDWELRRVRQTLEPELQALWDDLYLEDQTLLEQEAEEVDRSFLRSITILKRMHERGKINQLAKDLAKSDGKGMDTVKMQAEFSTLAQKLERS